MDNRIYKSLSNNKYFLLGFFTIIFIYLFIDKILGLTNWGVIHKVLLFDNSVTSRELILNSVFPLFSFYQNLGFPLLAESQAGIFEPFKLIFNIFFGSLNHINLTFFFRLVVLYSSLYILLNHVYKISHQTSFLTSLLAIFSPIIWNDSVHHFHLGSFYLLPLSIYFVEKYLCNSEYKKYVIAGSLVVLLQLLSGHFHYQLICLVILSIYCFVAVILLKPIKKNSIFLKLFYFSISIFLGFSLAAFQIIPTFELMLEGDRSDFKTTFQSSMSISGIAIFYKTLSKIFNNMDGSLSTLGYMTIFIYTVSHFLKTIKLKKLQYEINYLKYVLIFIIIYLFSLGEYFSFNNFIYKLVPFLESFRAPSRFMMVNSFCTLMLFALSFDELKKREFQVQNINFVFILMLITFSFVFLYFNQHIPGRTDVDLSYWRHFIKIFYPFVFIIGAYLILKLNYFLKRTFYIFAIFLFASLFENISFMNTFFQYSLFFDKKIINNNIIKAEELCEKYQTKALNIVGEFSETEEDYYYNFKKFKYLSVLSSEKCKVFYHHRRNDIVKRGLGYNQSSLATFKMTHLSNYQYDFLKKNFTDFDKKEFKYIASLLQNFTNSKVFYINQKNELKDDLLEIEQNIIEKFIYEYSYGEKTNIFDKIRNSSLVKNYILKLTFFENLFPKINLSELKLKKINNQYFLPIWQDNNFYVRKNDNFEYVSNFSFGKIISNFDTKLFIYYIPISFILGLLISFLATIIIISLYFYKKGK